jgi:hypothetical protein
MRDLISSAKVRDAAIKVVLAGLTVGAVLIFARCDKQSSPNRDDAKLQELRQIKSALPAFPDFTEASTGESSRGLMPAFILATGQRPAMTQ